MKTETGDEIAARIAGDLHPDATWTVEAMLVMPDRAPVPVELSASPLLDEHAAWRRSAELRMPDVSSPIVLQLRDGRGINPVAKVYRRFQVGPSESIAEFYRTSVAAAERLAK